MIGYDLQPSRVPAAARAADDIASLARDAEIVSVSLPDSSAVEAVVLGDSGVLAHCRSEQVVVDLSTAAPRSRVRLHAMVGERDVEFIDADMAGAGHTVKLLNNLLNAVSLAATAEVLVVARKAGPDLPTVLDVLNAGSGGRRRDRRHRRRHARERTRRDENEGEPMKIIHGRAAGSSSERRSATFTGEVWADPILAPTEGVTINHVFFAPQARTHWHTHEGGQLLMVTYGQGKIRADTGDEHRIRPGDTVWISPGERHWHGAGEAMCMAHVAISLGGHEWFEPVTDEEYRGSGGDGTI